MSQLAGFQYDQVVHVPLAGRGAMYEFYLWQKHTSLVVVTTRCPPTWFYTCLYARGCSPSLLPDLKVSGFQHL